MRWIQATTRRSRARGSGTVGSKTLIVEMSRKKVWRTPEKGAAGRFDFGKRRARGGYPLPTPLETLDWRWVYKGGLQDLERLGLRGQNRDNKRVASHFVVGACTASALTMICFYYLRGKVGCHRHGLCK